MGALIAVAALILLSILILGCDPQPADGSAGRYHLRERVGNFFAVGGYHTTIRHLREED
jgi:hypothetical protein